MTTGTNTLQNENSVEVTNISPFGIWILLNGTEHFLSYKDFPFFEDASIKALANVNVDHMGNLHWPELDIDLESDSIENPEEYPLVYFA